MDGTLFLASAMASFKAQKKLAERAVVQLSVEQLHQPLDENTNSMAVIMKHLAGNMLSRWTDFLTTDGEKDWRNRDGEFVDEFRCLEELMDFWRRGWECLFSALEALTAEDLSATVRIRGQAHTVIEAIHRQLDHYGYHVGQYGIDRPGAGQRSLEHAEHSAGRVGGIQPTDVEALGHFTVACDPANGGVFPRQGRAG